MYFSLRGPEYNVGDEDGNGEFDPESLEEWMSQQMQGMGGRGGRAGHVPRRDRRDALPGAAERRRGDDGGRWPGLPSPNSPAWSLAGPSADTYYLYRTLRNLDLDGMLERLVDESAQRYEGELTPLAERLEREEFENRIEQLKRENRSRDPAPPCG